VTEDGGYGDASGGADFDKQGRLVTASYDGYIRLYDKNFKLTAKKKAISGGRPYSINFAPDSSKIAVGFLDSTKVDVFSGKDLAYLYSPDNTGVGSGSTLSVAWSSDGKFLYAGKGGFRPTFIRKWTASGKGSYRDISAANYSYFHILPLNKGGIVFGASDPAFGVIDAHDQKTIFKGSFTADYRGTLDGFFISNDGFQVGFGYEAEGKDPGRVFNSVRSFVRRRPALVSKKH